MSPARFEPVERIAQTLLYEGYLLFPYRAESLKNRIRTSFGELGPAGGPAYRRVEQAAEIPIVATGATRVMARVAFLQPIRRTLRDASGLPISRLSAGGREIVAWDEAREVVVLSGPFRAEELEGEGIEADVEAPAVEETDRVGAGVVQRVGLRLVARLRLSLRSAGEGASGGTLLRCALRNVTPPESTDGDSLVMHASHVALALEEGAFASVVDPPLHLERVAAACEPDGAWFVLAGRRGDTHLALASPIILSDYPELAPESPTDLFDATENDELLALCTRSLGDDERRMAAATDSRAEALVDLLGSLPDAELGSLHGATRGFSTRAGSAARLRVGEDWVGAGDCVVLAPRGREALDAALHGKRARVVEVLVEVAGREHLVVVLDDDPGRDFGEASRGLGHRFFVSPSEVALVRPSDVAEGP